jgi:hypothetical protein
LTVKFLFDDESFSFKALRATGFADYGGAGHGPEVRRPFHSHHLGDRPEANGVPGG